MRTGHQTSSSEEHQVCWYSRDPKRLEVLDGKLCPTLSLPQASISLGRPEQAQVMCLSAQLFPQLSLIKNPTITYVTSHSSTDLFLHSVILTGELVFNMNRKLSLVYNFWTLLPLHLHPTLYKNFVANLLFLMKCFFPSIWHWSFTWIKCQIVKISHAQIEIMRQIWRDEDLAHTFYSHFLWPCLWGG